MSSYRNIAIFAHNNEKEGMVGMAKTAVIALGGNALLRGNQKGTIEEQTQNTLSTLENIVPLLKEGYNIVIGHGNGPQVGNILMQHAAGADTYGIPSMPLDVCVAESQGAIGYMIERSLREVMAKHGIKRDVCCLVTPVEVDPSDPAFKNPTKRVGRIYTKEQADALHAEKGWEFKEEVRETGSGWRRVVPSPKPISVLNADLVKNLVEAGVIVIAVGGGGVPVSVDADGKMNPIEAVIDKDLASSVLAATIGAEEFYILTDVPYVYINFRQPDEKKLERISRADVEKYLSEGMFGEGNMAPKVRACVDFLNKGGKVSIITEATRLADKACGTRIE